MYKDHHNYCKQAHAYRNLTAISPVFGDNILLYSLYNMHLYIHAMLSEINNYGECNFSKQSKANV